LRNAVEGIPSVLRRKYRIDEMPVRGYVRSKLWYFLKVGAINARRVLDWAVEQAILLHLLLFAANLHFSRLKIAREASH